MNGAEALVRTLLAEGVELCLANPGTSEMHLVQALDGCPELRSVLVLFEGVASGAADGYGRMRGAPAATLLHLGPGFANAAANLHNARRARTPVLNLVGDHTALHRPHDAPLTSDVEAIAAPFSAWVRTARDAAALPQDAIDALAAAGTRRPDSLGNVATLVVPVDAAWGPSAPATGRAAPPAPPQVPDSRIEAAARGLDGDTLILADGDALAPEGQRALARLAAATGCGVLATTFPARQDGGGGAPALPRLPYFPEQIREILAARRRLILAGAQAPVSFFAYQGVPSNLVPDGCEVLRLAHAHEDGLDALQRLVDRAGAAQATPAPGELRLPGAPSGPLSQRHAAALIARRLPDGAIVAVDSGGGGAAYAPCQRAAAHTWLALTGGAIGQGGPVAVGAALACPDRPVLALLGDGGAMYTNPFLWTAAREGLDVTVVIYANRKYNILEVEYRRLGVNEVGPGAAALFDMDRPAIDWVALGRAQGVPGERVETCEAFDDALARALAEPGPHLIEAVV